HSLLATQVTARVQAQLNLKAPLMLLFQAETLGDYAQALTHDQTAVAADFSELQDLMTELEAV
ncbi:phosphopantetheine-binding protein, partial [Pseudomonas sp. No.117]